MTVIRGDTIIAGQMSERLPIFVDPIRLADTGRELEGSIRLAEMDRLASYLVEKEGEVAVELSFGVDDQGVRYLHGRIRGQLELPCQRCLGPVTVPVDRVIDLGLVTSEVEAERLDAGYEPLMVSGRSMRLSDIVEDELLLALPMIALHPPSVCRPDYEGEAEQEPEAPRKNPFEVLAELKKPK